MFIAALLFSIVGFVLLIVTLVQDSQIWTWLLIVVALSGISCFIIDELQKKKRRKQ